MTNGTSTSTLLIMESPKMTPFHGEDWMDNMTINPLIPSEDDVDMVRARQNVVLSILGVIFNGCLLLTVISSPRLRK